MGFTESIAVAKEEAVRHDYEIDANQEMIANGMSNLGAGLFQSFAVNGSLSKSAACETAGGNTQVASALCAFLTLATILFLTGLFTYLPEATLGANQRVEELKDGARLRRLNTPASVKFDQGSLPIAYPELANPTSIYAMLGSTSKKRI